jgi:hypothetical protein
MESSQNFHTMGVPLNLTANETQFLKEASAKKTSKIEEHQE